MRRIFIAALLLAPVLTQAQTKAKLEIFTGMDYVRAVINPGIAQDNQSLKASITSAKDHKLLWQGTVTATHISQNGITKSTFTVNGLKPQLWTPTHPNLYELTVQTAQGAYTQRLGFRMFDTHDGHLYLNNHPIFLRGIAINPPGRGIPDQIEKSRKFALDYVAFMKSIHVNIIRIPDDETWYNVCDELGMMVFGGNYSGLVDEQKPPKDYDKAVTWYEEQKFEPIAHHPSLMVYAMTNEVEYGGKLGDAWQTFLKYAHAKLRQWDETRLYIGNAGYGYGVAGDICDLHRYWGWYYNSPFTFLHIRNNEEIIPFKKKVQAVTFTECVGNYTGPDGRYNLTPDHKNPGSQLNWTGHAPQNEQAALADEHQCFTFRQATETFRQLRNINPELSGVFPFTIMFHNWDTIKGFADMDPKAVTKQAKLSYQPVLLSWECWTSQVYAGSTIKPIIHIINDDDNFADLANAKVQWQISDKAGKAVASGSLTLPTVKYYDTWQQQISVSVPATLASGNYTLEGNITQNGKIVSHNVFPMFIGAKTFADVKTGAVVLYDVNGKTADALNKLGIKSVKTDNLNALNPTQPLVIGENSANDALVAASAKIKEFVQRGGRVLALRQDSAHLPKLNSILNHPVKNVTLGLDTPQYPPPPRPARNGYNLNPERPDHPVFAGIKRENMRVWSDYSGWNENKPNMPAIYPVTDGFVVGDKNDIAETAVLANYDVALQSIAIAEMFNGKGSVTLCGLDLAGRNSIDPIADKMLGNLVKYVTTASGHENYPLISQPIVWGEYDTEKGVLTGINSGLMVNGRAFLTGKNADTKMVLTEEGSELAGRGSGFNTRPGIQYVAYGRRAYGPYVLRGFGNVPAPESKNGTIGEGQFWCRVPVGTAKAENKIWNPADVPLSITISVNGQPVQQEIPAGKTVVVSSSVNSTTVNMSFKADRRLVILQTVFRK